MEEAVEAEIVEGNKDPLAATPITARGIDLVFFLTIPRARRTDLKYKARGGGGEFLLLSKHRDMGGRAQNEKGGGREFSPESVVPTDGGVKSENLILFSIALSVRERKRG